MPPQANQTAGPQSDYQFIFNEPPKTVKMPSKMILIAGGLGLLMLIVLLASLLFGGSDKHKTELLDLMARQQEILRVTDLATNKDLTSNTKALLVTLSATVSSDRIQFKSYYASTVSKKIDAKLLTTYRSSQTDAKLASAAQNGHYEDTLIAAIVSELKNYQAALKIDYTKITGKNGRTILTTAYNNNKDILTSLGYKDTTTIEDTTQSAVTNGPVNN